MNIEPSLAVRAIAHSAHDGHTRLNTLVNQEGPFAWLISLRYC